MTTKKCIHSLQDDLLVRAEEAFVCMMKRIGRIHGHKEKDLTESSMKSCSSDDQVFRTKQKSNGLSKSETESLRDLRCLSNPLINGDVINES